MALIVSFKLTSFTTEKYDEVIKRLEAAGAGAPAGRLYHICFGSGDNLQVTDVWESQASFEAFGQTLMPILQGLEIDPGQPEIHEIHNTILG